MEEASFIHRDIEVCYIYIYTYIYIYAQNDTKIHGDDIRSIYAN